MNLVFYSIVLNQHQAPLAEALWECTNHSFCFVELANVGASHRKGDTNDYSSCPYLLRAWESAECFQKAMELARTAECCVFGGTLALPFQKERMKLGMLSFDMGERWLKKGMINLCSPAIAKMFVAYWLGGWSKKPLYKLCMSAYAKGDHEKLGMYKGKCYKWGYFTQVSDLSNENDDESENFSKMNSVRLMWCARFLTLKHPELPIQMMAKLKQIFAGKPYRVHLDIYGGEGNQNAHESVYTRKDLEELASKLGVADMITFRGMVTNTEVLQAMREHDIFLFTSNRLEGWGAVVNEAMSNGCVVVGNDVIGSVPYLLEHRATGCRYHNTLESLTAEVQWLIENPEERKRIAKNGFDLLRNVWSPRNAAESLLQLIDDIKNDRDTSIKEGPCSKA